MKGLDALSALRDINLKELDLESLAGWPVIAKSLLCFIIAVLIGFLGYQFNLSTLQDDLDQAIKQEDTLKRQLKIKVEKAANLQAYRKQMQQMEKTFSSLVHQLPGDTEVPSLLEDITQIGLGAGLEFEAITLKSEVNREFFIELPIQIKAKGRYHDIGNFVSGVSSLKRIVTLHNFRITPNKSGELNVEILAKTYRYKGEGASDG